MLSLLAGILFALGLGSFMGGGAVLSDTFALNRKGMTLDLELKPETALKISLTAIAAGMTMMQLAAYLFQSSLPTIPTGPYP